jgi:hypothetical protein
MHNALSFYKKQTLVDNPFDEKLYGKEDRYWAADMVSKQATFYYEPTFSCLHHWTSNGATWKGIG